jgi:hypothetical protein
LLFFSNVFGIEAYDEEVDDTVDDEAEETEDECIG